MSTRKINVLDEQLANQIAAGEVVERPASIVKEAIENAIDAEATQIDISCEEGGLVSIKITDDGSGIASDDLPQAFLRHATSKITTSSDLFKIASLGFRGEALPSIAAVSRLEIMSSDSDSGLARKLVYEGGQLAFDEPANAPKGTSLLIKDIFFNTPARLKYMKSIQTELGHISDYVNRISLAHPEIAFTLQHNGNTLLRTLGTGDRLQVIAAVYGGNTAKAMHRLKAEDADYRIEGYVSKPELNRSNRNGITVIVNGRYIRSFAVNQALVNAYHTFLPINRYPLAVLNIQMHPSLLDVNVHPSKMEVRFSKEQELKQLLETAVRALLESERYIPHGNESIRTKREKEEWVQDSMSFKSPIREQVSSSFSSPPAVDYVKPAQHVPKDAAERLYAPSQHRFPDKQNSADRHIFPETAEPQTVAETNLWPVIEDYTASPDQNEAMQQSAAYPSDRPGTNGPSGESASSEFPELHWIGQHHGTYIVAQSEDGLYLIDQHAAHERIHYEYFLHKFGTAALASQQLLVPITLEYTAVEAAALRGMLDLLLEAGVELEPFGQQTFLVRALPDWMPKGQEGALLEEMTNWLIAEKKAVPIGKLREKAAIMCACKASIKANDRITREEGEVLLARLSQCQQPYTCPHGRPIIVHFTIYELQKMFKRVMT